MSACAISPKEEIMLLPVRRVESVQLGREMLLDMVGEADPGLGGTVDNKVNTGLQTGYDSDCAFMSPLPNHLITVARDDPLNFSFP